MTNNKLNIDKYVESLNNDDGLLSDTGYGSEKANATNRRFLHTEPNITVRDQYRKSDFYSFRDGGEVDDKENCRQCMEAYKNIGIISTIIDLMGDFGSQGIHIVHPNKGSERFLRNWATKVGMPERSERFLNTLYRAGTTVIKRKWGKIPKKQKRQMSRAKMSPRLPLGYKILNPLMIDVENPQDAIFTGDVKYILLPPSSVAHLVKNNQISRSKFNVNKGMGSRKEIPLKEEDIAVYHYKKDDWELWGRPLISPILDDLATMEQMKLADMSALDGAISNIRLWTLGIIDGPTNSILPTKKSIARLREILAANVGGGTMDLVWGPELKFTESATELYKWLGDEKYVPVLNSIYAGLGVPPTMTGMSESSGSFTNNFVSLKVMVDRLEYGRRLLVDFWSKEIKMVSKAMGIQGSASLKFDHMALHDEAAEKALLIQLADRNYISVETLQERFKEDPEIELSRIQREHKEMKDGLRPEKASPYHNPDKEHELNKIEVTEKTREKYKPKGSPSDGRPKNATDKKPRKQRRVLPKASLQLWASHAHKLVSEKCTEAYLHSCDKKNIRYLNKAECNTLEKMKFIALSNLEPMSDVNASSLFSAFKNSQNKVKPSVLSRYNELLATIEKPTIEDRRALQILAYVYEN